MASRVKAGRDSHRAARVALDEHPLDLLARLLRQGVLKLEERTVTIQLPKKQSADK